MTKLMVYKCFLISKDPSVRSQLIESKKIYFSAPPENALYFKGFFENNSKTIKCTEKFIDGIFDLHEIPHLLVYLWPLWDK